MFSAPIVKIQYLESYDLEKWGELKYAHKGDCGIDVRAAIEKPIIVDTICNNKVLSFIDHPLNYEAIKLIDNEYCNYIEIIPTGIKVAIPEGYHIEVRPRSGLAAKYGITVVNAPGSIDSGFLGEIKVILANLGKKYFIIKPGDRIAQIVLMKHEIINFSKTNQLDETERGENGFGSTGLN